MREPSINLRGVGKRYGDDIDAWAVRNVTVSIFPGELTVLMGPSGSGKTTLLCLVGALLKPTAGQVNVCGTDLEQCGEEQLQAFRRRQIGFIFQNYNLLSSLTAAENIQVALALRGGDERLAGELLERIDLADKAGAYPLELSGGQRQRVAVMRAVAGDPAVLLADEPTAALDAFQGRRVMQLLRATAHEQGTTVLVVTHDPRVRDFADRVIEMEDGHLKRIVRRLWPQTPTSFEKDAIVPVNGRCRSSEELRYAAT
jgi:putative ABC transport system ATP-binding protein